jgi:hypothetical protein
MAGCGFAVWNYTITGGRGALLYTCHMADYSISQLRVLPPLWEQLEPGLGADLGASRGVDHAGAFHPIHALVQVRRRRDPPLGTDDTDDMEVAEPAHAAYLCIRPNAVEVR